MDIKKEVARQYNIIIKKSDEVLPKNELNIKLEKAIKENKKLKIKFGIDPTGSEMHLGHAIPLMKLREFQELGHDVYLIIGNFTARIGDPTGKSDTRKMLTLEEIQGNLKSYLNQASKILDINNLKVLYNNDWLESLSLSKLMELLSSFTIAQCTSREDFANRLKNNESVSLVELMYPILQGYDSYFMEADIEIGGTDQKFNLLKGRDVQKIFKQEPQICITFPILEGLYGKDKMSKSLNNYIPILDNPNNMFGKVMSIPDSLLTHYFDLTLKKEFDDIENLININPYEAKKLLAFELVKFYHSELDSLEAKKYFEDIFSRKVSNLNIEEIKIKEEIEIIGLIMSSIKISKTEAKRLISSGAIKLDNIKIMENILLKPNNQILRIGKKYIFRVINDIKE